MSDPAPIGAPRGIDVPGSSAANVEVGTNKAARGGCGMDQLRRRCAERLQRQLADPQLRAEKVKALQSSSAALAASLGPAPCSARSDMAPGSRIVEDSAATCGLRATRGGVDLGSAAGPCGSAATSSAVAPRPKSAGPSRGNALGGSAHAFGSSCSRPTTPGRRPLTPGRSQPTTPGRNRLPGASATAGGVTVSRHAGAAQPAVLAARTGAGRAPSRVGQTEAPHVAAVSSSAGASRRERSAPLASSRSVVAAQNRVAGQAPQNVAADAAPRPMSAVFAGVASGAAQGGHAVRTPRGRTGAGGNSHQPWGRPGASGRPTPGKSATTLRSRATASGGPDNANPPMRRRAVGAPRGGGGSGGWHSEAPAAIVRSRSAGAGCSRAAAASREAAMSTTKANPSGGPGSGAVAVRQEHPPSKRPLRSDTGAAHVESSDGEDSDFRVGDVQVNLRAEFSTCLSPTLSPGAMGDQCDQDWWTLGVPEALRGRRRESEPRSRSTEHFCIADRSPETTSASGRSAAPDSRTRQFQDVLGSLETAAASVRQAIEARGGGLAHQETAGAARTWRGFSPDSLLASGDGGRATSPLLARAAAAASGWDEKAEDTLLAKENQALRSALSETVARVAELEGEQQRIMSEGIFDLVNSVALNTGLRGGRHGDASDEVRPPVAADGRHGEVGGQSPCNLEMVTGGGPVACDVVTPPEDSPEFADGQDSGSAENTCSARTAGIGGG